MKKRFVHQRGLSLIEMMIAIVIGLFLITMLLSLYLVQSQTYRTTASQGFTQNAENAIAQIILPTIRQAGFAGCLTLLNAQSNLTAGGPPPLGTINTNPSMIMGYEATTGITQFNAANSSTAGNWSPNLDSTLAGLIEAGSDVLVVLGPTPNSQPMAVSSITPTGNSFTIQGASGAIAGQYGVISDCAKASIFRISNVSGNTISHTQGGGGLSNVSDTFPVSYPIGAQFIPLQQMAFFIGQGLGGQSSLMRATYNGSTWTVQPLVPGVDTMQVLYGIGVSGVPTRYVPASGVVNWGNVYSVRLAFIIEGQIASGGANSVNPTQFSILGVTMNLPVDNRLRHVFEMTIKVRNSLL